MNFETLICRQCSRIVERIPQDGVPKCNKCGNEFEWLIEEIMKPSEVERLLKDQKLASWPPALYPEKTSEKPLFVFKKVVATDGRWYPLAFPTLGELLDQVDTPIIVDPPTR